MGLLHCECNSALDELHDDDGVILVAQYEISPLDPEPGREGVLSRKVIVLG